MSDDNNYTINDFNKLSLELCNDISKTFPALDSVVDKTRKLLEKIIKEKENEDKNEDENENENEHKQKKRGTQFLNYFVKHVVPFMYPISKMDHTTICGNKMFIMSGLSFEQLWQHVENPTAGHAIWKYLFSLYLMAVDCDEYQDLVELNKEHHNAEKIQYTVFKHSKISKNIMKSNGVIAEEMLRHMSESVGKDGDTSKGIFGEKILENKDLEEKFMNSSIGNLAKEISEEISPDDLEMFKDPAKLLSGGLQGEGLSKLIQNVGSKLQGKMQNDKFDETKMMSEAQDLMGALGGTFGPMMGQLMGSMGGDPNGVGGGLNPMSMMSTMMGMGNDKKKKKHKRRHKHKNREHVESVGENQQ